MVGSRNRISTEVRAMILGALEDAGGRDYLVKQALEKPQAFLALLARLLPANVNADVPQDRPVQIQVVTGIDSGPHER